MSDAVPFDPVRYTPSVETPEEDEQQTATEIGEAMRKIREKTFADSGHAIRSVHAKSHGLLRGELRVIDGLPAVLAQGLFATPGTYSMVMRFSTIPGDILDDNVSTPRGLAIKVVGVPGERLAGSTDATTQDFVLVNAPAFNAPNTRKFLTSLKPLVATTDRAEGLKKALSTTLQGVERIVEAFGGKSRTLISLGGHPETNLLGESYYSAAAIRYGDHIAKVSVAPTSPALASLKDAKVDLSDQPDGLRQAVIDHFAAEGGEWELRVQLCTDLQAMPVEDPSVEWPEAKSPYVAVARLTVQPQAAWSAARAAVVDDGYSFSPWHGLAAHQPLGSVMRARKAAYEASARFRAERNGRPFEEPSELDSLPN